MPGKPEFLTQESMQLINEMIGKAKRSYISNGIASMVWGALIVLCSLLTWMRITFHFYPGFDVWLLLIFALIPQIYFGRKERRAKDFVAHDDNTTIYMWIAFAVSIFITSFYNSKYGNDGSATSIMILYGMPTFILGGIYKFKQMVTGGIICWILSIISVYTSAASDMLLIAACGLFAWVIPGIILWPRYKTEQVSNV